MTSLINNKTEIQFKKDTEMLKKIAFILAALVITQAAQANVCKDDPRMYTIKTIINQLEAGEAIKPIKLTPYTFLNLSPQVRNALGDNVMVFDDNCVPYQIYQGNPAKKITIAFEDLSNFMHHAAIRGDSKALNMVVSSFRAAPKTTDEAVVLVSSLNWTTAAIDTLYKEGLFHAVGQENYYHKDEMKICNGFTAMPTSIDLFALIGGSVSDRVKTSFEIDNSSLSIQTLSGTRRTNSGLGQVKSETWCSGVSVARTHNSLVQVGVDLVQYGGSSGYSNTDSWLKEMYAKTEG
jgi:hypothetical protein